MATTDYDFYSTRNDIIARAFRMIGVLSLGQTLDGDQINQGVNVLNDMVKSWQAKKVFLWTQKTLTFSTVATDSDYVLEDDPPVMWVDSAFITLNGDEYPLASLSKQQYESIPDKEDAGDPTHFYCDNEHSPTIYLWPTPNAVRTIRYIGIVRLQDAETASGTLDFPARWTNALTYGLAYELSNEYKLPLNERGYLRNEAENQFSIAKRSDRSRQTDDFIKGAY